MKRPMTAKELFEKIEGILREKGLLPDILDYSLPERDEQPISTYEFCIRNNLDYGGSEGIYLDIGIEFLKDGERVYLGLGTIKTLCTDQTAMWAMAKLLADFIMELHKYVNGHLDDFTWEGFDVYAYDETGNRLEWGYTCSDRKGMEKIKKELLEKYPRVTVRDNATRKITAYDSDESCHKGDV